MKAIQKTWTELLGKFDPRSFVMGRDIVARTDNPVYDHKTVWSFDGEQQAQHAFEAWKEGR